MTWSGAWDGLCPGCGCQGSRGFGDLVEYVGVSSAHLSVFARSSFVASLTSSSSASPPPVGPLVRAGSPLAHRAAWSWLLAPPQPRSDVACSPGIPGPDVSGGTLVHPPSSYWEFRDRLQGSRGSGDLIESSSEPGDLVECVGLSLPLSRVRSKVLRRLAHLVSKRAHSPGHPSPASRTSPILTSLPGSGPTSCTPSVVSGLRLLVAGTGRSGGTLAPSPSSWWQPRDRLQGLRGSGTCSSPRLTLLNWA